MSHDSPRLLLIEEDALLAEITGFRLELLGFHIESVSSGEAAVAAVERELPDAILLDPTLPDMDGIELTNRFSNDERTSAVPILVISSSGDLNDVAQAHAAGARDYLVIPYNPATLEEKLQEILQTVGKTV